MPSWIREAWIKFEHPLPNGKAWFDPDFSTRVEIHEVVCQMKGKTFPATRALATGSSLNELIFSLGYSGGVEFLPRHCLRRLKTDSASLYGHRSQRFDVQWFL